MQTERSLTANLRTACVALLAVFVTVEFMFAQLDDQLLPVPFWYAASILAASVALAWGIASIFVRTLRHTPRFTLYGSLVLVGVILTMKLYLVAGLFFWQPYVYVLAPLGVLGLIIRYFPLARSAPVVLLSLLVGLFLSTNVLKKIFNLTWDTSYRAIGIGLGLDLLLVAGFLGGTVVLPLLGRTLGASRRRSVLVLSLLVIFLGASWTYARAGAADPGDADPPPVSASVSGPEDRSTSELPNIILISIDTLRLDRVRPESSRSLKLPHLENFREDAITFRQFVSTSGWTPPSHASLFTGRLPVDHGAVLGQPIEESVPLFPQYLQLAGYWTGGFTDGGWMSKELGFARGYDDYHEQLLGYGDFLPGALELAQLLLPKRYRLFKMLSLGRNTRKTSLKRFSRTVRRGQNWIISRPDDRPFYLFMHTFRVHNYSDMYPQDVERLKRDQPHLLDSIPPAVAAKLKHHLASVTTARLRTYSQLYDYGIETIDAQLGNFFDQLKSHGLYKPSYIILLSDHGEIFKTEPGLKPGHGDGQIHEILLRVPLFVKLPGNAGAGREYEGLTQMTDIFPMIFQHMDLEIQSGRYDSPPHTFTSILDGTDEEGRDFTRGSRGHMDHPDSGPRVFVRGRDVKLELNLASGQQQFYRVSRGDPDQSPVASVEVDSHPRHELEDAMRSTLKRFQEGSNPYSSRQMNLSPKQVRELKGLGYLK